MKNSVQYIEPEPGATVNALLTDYRWAYLPGETLEIRYSFYDSDSQFFVDSRFGYDRDDPLYDLPFRDGFGGLSEEQRDYTRDYFDVIETAVDIRFVEVEDSLDSDIRIGITDLSLENADGLAFLPSPDLTPFDRSPETFHDSTGLGGDVWLDVSLDPFFFPEVVVHEVGRALGLAHPFQNGFRERRGVDNVILDGELDYNRYTAMAYELYPSSVRDADVLFTSTVATLMPLDLEALQFLYGESRDDGNDVYLVDDLEGDFELGSLTFDDADLHKLVNSYITIDDAGGYNALVLNLDQDLRIELNGGEWSNTEGGLLTRQFDDPNLFLDADTSLDELHFTGSGEHAASFDARPLSAYKFVESEAGTRVQAVDGPLDVLVVGAEQLSFADIDLAVDGLRGEINARNQGLLLDSDRPLYQSRIGGDAEDVSVLEAQLYRLYYGGLGRAPDRGGFEWWTEQLQDGVYDFAEVASRFIGSPEFKGLADVDGNGRISDAEFLDNMYLNVFGREPDEAGYAFWLGELSSGKFTQPLAFANMVQSDEFVLLTAGTVGDFIFL